MPMLHSLFQRVTQSRKGKQTRLLGRVPPFPGYNASRLYQMSIIEIDQRRPPTQSGRARTTWQHRLRRHLYQANYGRAVYPAPEPDLPAQDRRAQGVISLVRLIREKPPSEHRSRREFYDPQVLETHYSAYSVFIPIENESYMKDQVRNTIPYISSLYDRQQQGEAMQLYRDISQQLKQADKNDPQQVQTQWRRIKDRYLCSIDSVTAVLLMLQLTKRGSKVINQLYRSHGRGCLREIFLHRVSQASMYIRPSVHMRRNLQISMQIGEEINEKTLANTMKTWYCAICMSYVCERHHIPQAVLDGKCEYVCRKNKIGEGRHLESIVAIVRVYEELRSEGAMRELEQSQAGCGPNCYKDIKKVDIVRLNMARHKLISPLAKALLKLGIEMFSYDPCRIKTLFQANHQSNMIDCSLIFIHFVEECNLFSLLDKKMYKSEHQHLIKQPSRHAKPVVKPPTKCPKSNHYLNKRAASLNPEYAVCFHNFVGGVVVDGKCSSCVCTERGFCTPSCLCTQECEIRRIGCSCKDLSSCQTNNCLCFNNQMECQPGICDNCFHIKHKEKQHSHKRNNCRNNQIIKDMSHRMIIGVSGIAGAGLGAFAAENYNKNDLVCRYSGEHISCDLDSIREFLIKDNSFYNFDSPNGKVILASIDARFLGNKARFINHNNNGEENLRAETKYSNGTEVIALYASRDITEGEELFFNYDGNGKLYKDHRDKYPFIGPPKK